MGNISRRPSNIDVAALHLDLQNSNFRTKTKTIRNISNKATGRDVYVWKFHHCNEGEQIES